MSVENVRLAPIHGCCSVDRGPSSKKIGYSIGVALSTIVLLGGIFLLLSAHAALPPGFNVISHLKGWGYVLGYGVAVVGFFSTACSVWKLKHQWSSHESVSPPPINLNEHPPPGISLDAQIEWAKRVDTNRVLTSWKASNQDEVHQTFSAFKSLPEEKTNIHRRHLTLLMMDKDISKEEEGMLWLVAQYIQITHGITTVVGYNYECLTSEMKRHNGNTDQYALFRNLAELSLFTGENKFVMGVISHDLYPENHPLSFIFGAGDAYYAAGLISLHHFRDSNFKVTFRRLIQLVAHELGHMRGLHHCTLFDCNMQGTNGQQDSDRIPLTFCAEDMAKICHLNGWSLLEGYQKQLALFEGPLPHNGKTLSFSEVGFSREIEHLKQKISALQ